MDAAYIEDKGKATKLPIEELNTMLPFPDAFRRGNASWLRWKEDSKFVPIIVDNSWAVMSVALFRINIPALFT